MKKLVRGMALVIAGLGLLGATTMTAQAASKSAALPQSYRGTWYVYDGVFSTRPTLYSVEKVQLSNHQMKTATYFSAYKQLTQLTKQYSASLPVTYTKRSGGGYKVTAKGQKAAFGTLNRTAVKVKGKKTTALKMRLSGLTMYAFRHAVASHPAGFY